MIIKIIKEQLEKQAKAKQRHLNNIKARDEQLANDPYDLKGLRFAPEDEGQTFTRTTNMRRENNGVLWTSNNKCDYTNVIQRRSTFKVVNGAAVLISNEEVKTYISPPSEKWVNPNNTILGSMGFVKRPKD